MNIIQKGPQLRLVQMPVADLGIAGQQYRDQLVVAGHQRLVGIDIDGLDLEAILRLPGGQGVDRARTDWRMSERVWSRSGGLRHRSD